MSAEALQFIGTLTVFALCHVPACLAGWWSAGEGRTWWQQVLVQVLGGSVSLALLFVLLVR